MLTFSPIEALKSLGASATSSLSAPLNIQSRQVEVRRQIELIRNSDLLSENDRVTRSNFMAARSRNDSSVATLRSLTDKLNAVRKAAQGIQGGVGFLGFSFKTGNDRVVTGEVAKGTQVGNFDVVIDQLANSSTGQKATGTVNGAAFSSDSNTLVDAGGISGLTLHLLGTTPSTTTTSTVVTELGSLVSADANNEKIKLSSGTFSSLSDGTEVQLTGVALGGVAANTSYFVNKLGSGSHEIRLYDTKEHALAGGSAGRIDIGDGGPGTKINTVSTSNTTTKQGVTVVVGKSKEDAIGSAKAFFNAVADALNFVDSATAEGGSLHEDRTAVNAGTGLRHAILDGFSMFGNAIKSKATSNAISLDAGKLGNAFDADFTKVEDLFRNGNGIASRVESFSALTVNLGGTLDIRTNRLERNSTSFDDQLRELRNKAEEQRAKLLDAFSSIASSLSAVGRQSSFAAELGQDRAERNSSDPSISNIIKPRRGTISTGIDSKTLEVLRERFATTAATN